MRPGVALIEVAQAYDAAFAESIGRPTLPHLKAIDPICNRVWTLPELDILHELHKPVCVLIPVIHDTAHQ